MKFKNGQKVRVKVWEDMPWDLYDLWGYAKRVGVIATIEGINTFSSDFYSGYDVEFEDKSSACYFEEELESVIKVGEQLLFSFMEEG